MLQLHLDNFIACSGASYIRGFTVSAIYLRSGPRDSDWEARLQNSLGNDLVNANKDLAIIHKRRILIYSKRTFGIENGVIHTSWNVGMSNYQQMTVRGASKITLKNYFLNIVFPEHRSKLVISIHRYIELWFPLWNSVIYLNIEVALGDNKWIYDSIPVRPWWLCCRDLGNHLPNGWINDKSNLFGDIWWKKCYRGTMYIWASILTTHNLRCGWYIDKVYIITEQLVYNAGPRRRHCEDSKWMAYSKTYTLQWRHDRRHTVSNNQPHRCLLSRLFRRKSKKTSKVRVNGLCVMNLPVTGEFPAQMASNVENFSVWWRHHETNLWDWHFAVLTGSVHRLENH